VADVGRLFSIPSQGLLAFSPLSSRLFVVWCLFFFFFSYGEEVFSIFLFHS